MQTNKKKGQENFTEIKRKNSSCNISDDRYLRKRFGNNGLLGFRDNS